MGFLRKKRFYIPAVLFLLIGSALYFASDWAKSYLEKNSRKLIGRRVVLEKLSFNYWNFAVSARHFQIFEDDDTSVFGGFRHLVVDFQPWNLLKGEYAFSQIELDSLYLKVIKYEDSFNFDSLLSKDSVNQVSESDSVVGDVKFLVENIGLYHGRLDFHDATVNNHLVLDNLNLNLPQIAWNNRESNAGVEFEVGESGHALINAGINHAMKHYFVDFKTSGVDIGFIKNYLTPYLAISDITGKVDLDVKLEGSTINYDQLKLKGFAQLSDFMMADSNQKQFFKLASLGVQLDSISLNSNSFCFDTVKISRPYVFASLMPKTNNFEQLLQPYIKSAESRKDTISVDKAGSKPIHYQVNHVLLDGGEVEFSDFTLNRPFHYRVNDILLSISDLSDQSPLVSSAYSMNMNGNGVIKGKTVFSIEDSYLLQHQASVSKLQLQSFSPYSEFYLAHGINGGYINYDFSIDMSKKHLLNQNKVHIQNLKFGKRTKDSTATKLPIRFALYLLSDKEDKIKFELPVTGDPSDPQFKLGKIIWKTVATFLVKTTASPFNALSGIITGDPEKLKNIDFILGQDSIESKQIIAVDRLVGLHADKPDLLLSFVQYTDATKERELIAVDIAKNMMRTSLQIADSIAGTVTNQQLNEWILARQPLTQLSMEQKCIQLVGSEKVDRAFLEKTVTRNESLTRYLQSKGDLNFRVVIGDLNNIPDDMKRPHFKVDIELP